MTPFYARFLDFPKYKFTLFSLKTLNSLSLSLSHSRRPNALPLSFRHLAWLAFVASAGAHSHWLTATKTKSKDTKLSLSCFFITFSTLVWFQLFGLNDNSNSINYHQDFVTY